MNIYTISNSHITAKIKKFGAELTSLQTSDGHEYLWQGHPDHWTGQSPLLFPIIGGLPEDSYELENRTWNMKSHGFARKSDFKVECSNSNSIILNLESNRETLKTYPFKFRVSIIYSVHDNSLEVTYEVQNNDIRTMPFSIGGHPAFNCPLEEGRSLEDYQLIFEQKESADRLLKEILLTGQTETCLDNSDSIKLSHKLFDRGALIFRDLESNKVTLDTPGGTRSVMMEFPDFTHFAIWKKAHTDAPFICLEPWFGVDSTEGGPRELNRKEGIVLLEPNDVFSSCYSLRIK